MDYPSKSKKLFIYALAMMMFAQMLPTHLPAKAEGIYGKRTFKVTAYYSPLPDQKFYLRGNYEDEKRLNGNGIAGASGRKVFPGMIAAPKTYAFGTKIYLEGLGVGTVADRGGAIVKAGERGQDYDRLDIWMGHGDEGLARALKWGVRTVEGEVLLDKTAADTISFDGSGPAKVETMKVESLNVALPSPELTTKAAILTKENEQFIATVDTIASENELVNSFPGYMGADESGAKVKILQAALKKLGYYNANISGIYDDNTIVAVLQFQLQYKILNAEDAHAAGYFGVETRKTLLSILESKNIDMSDIETTAMKAEDIIESTPLLSATSRGEMTVATPDTMSIPLPKSQMSISSFSSATIAATTPSSQKTPRQIAYLDPATAKGVVLAQAVSDVQSMSSKEISALQNQLRSLGYYKDVPSGVWSTSTGNALVAFQGRVGLPTSGELDVKTEEALDRVWRAHVATWGFTKEMKSGDSYEDVQKLQNFLKTLDFYRGAVDGKYSQDLAQAVLDFQIDYGIVADTEIYGAGMVGPRTLAKLNQILFKFI